MFKLFVFNFIFFWNLDFWIFIIIGDRNFEVEVDDLVIILELGCGVYGVVEKVWYV